MPDLWAGTSVSEAEENMKEYIDAPKSMVEEAERAALKAAYAEITISDDGPDGITDILKAFSAVRQVEKEYSKRWLAMTEEHGDKSPMHISFHSAHHIVASAILAKSDFGGQEPDDMHPYNATAYHFARMCFAVVALEAFAAAKQANDCEFYSDHHYADNVLKLLES